MPRGKYPFDEEMILNKNQNKNKGKFVRVIVNLAHVLVWKTVVVVTERTSSRFRLKCIEPRISGLSDRLTLGVVDHFT